MNFAIGLPMIVQVDKTCSNLLQISVSPIILRPGSFSKANFSSGNTVVCEDGPGSAVKKLDTQRGKCGVSHGGESCDLNDRVHGSFRPPYIFD